MTDYSDIPRGWHQSSGGNPQIVYNGIRITVFDRDGGWKFCLAVDDEDDEDPYFSEVYDTRDAAMYEAFAQLDGMPSQYKTKRQIREEREAKYWSDYLNESKAVSSKARDVLPRALNDPKINITKLRPSERKIASRIKAMERARDHFYIESEDALYAASNEVIAQLHHMLAAIRTKIEWLKSTPKNLR